MAKNKIEYDVVVDASDATKELGKLGDAGTKAGQELSKGLAKGADAAGRDIDGLIAKVEKLGAGKAANLLLTNNFKDIENDIVDLTIKLDELDANDPEVDVTVTRLGELQGDLDTVTSKIRELNSTDAVIDVKADTSQVEGALDRARGGTDKLTASAQKSRNAFANMVGNVGQDLGALVGIAGSAGVGLGQLAEGAADASNDGEKLGSVLKGVATSALPIAALGIGVGLISSAMANAKKKAQELDAATRRFTEGLEATVGASQELDEALDSAFDVGQASNAAIVAREFLDALDPKKVHDYQTALDELGLTNEQFISELQAAGGTVDWFAKRQLFAAGASDGVIDSVSRLIAQYDGYDEILNSVVDGPSKDFIEQNEQLVRGLDDVGQSIGALDLERLAKNFLDTQRNISTETRIVNEAVDSTNNYTDALDRYLQLKQRQNREEQRSIDQAEAYAAAIDSGVAGRQAFNDEQAEMVFTAGELADALTDLQDPLKTLPATWAVLIDNFHDGQFDLENAEVLINRIAEATGRPPGDILDIISTEADKAQTALEKTGTALDHVSASGFVGAQGEISAATQATTDALNAQADAYQAALDKQQAMIDAAQGYADAQQAFRDATADLPGIIAETNAVMADSEASIEDRTAAMRTQRDETISWIDGMVQTRQEFEAQNGTVRTAAETQADYAEGLGLIAGTLNDDVIPAVADYYSDLLDIPEERQTEFEMILARGDEDEIEAFIAENSGTTAMSIEMELEQKKLNEVKAQIGSATQPRTLPVTAVAHTVVAKGQIAAAFPPVSVPVNANTNPAKQTMDSFRRNQANTPIYVKVQTVGVTPGYVKPAAATAGALGAAPLALTPFEGDEQVGVTPYAGDVAVASFGTPVGGSSSFTPTVHNHVTIQAAVIGSRFDVQRAVTKALRSAQRINGGRAA